jgi:hypothetical protein
VVRSKFIRDTPGIHSMPQIAFIQYQFELIDGSTENVKMIFFMFMRKI